VFFFASNVVLVHGSGTYYADACPHLPFFMTSALSSLAFVAIHTSVAVVDFSEQEYTTYLQYIEAYGAQLFACVLTLGNLFAGGCMIVLPCLLALALVLMSRASTSFLEKASR